MAKIRQISILIVILILILLLVPHLSLARTAILEAKHHQGEGQYDFITLEVDTNKLRGKMYFLNSEFSNIGDDVVARAAALDGKHHLDLSKYEHIKFDFILYRNYETVSFVSPVLSLQNDQYSFVFIGNIKGSRLKGTLYEYLLDYTGHRHLTEIQIL